MENYLTGILFSSIAQLSHIQYECIQLNTANKNDFLYNQVSSSMNYKTDHLFTRTICFGLDLQIEHHLFPNICHVHYPNISKIVKQTALEYNLPYHSYKNFTSALRAHTKMLYNLGKYDDAPAIH